jgi:Resolvase, N terminal domain
VSVAESLDTATAAGRLVLNVMAAVSQWEREAIGERTREALGHKRAAGQRVGTIPFGSQLAPDGSSLLPNHEEQRVLRLLRGLRGSGLTLGHRRRTEPPGSPNTSRLRMADSDRPSPAIRGGVTSSSWSVASSRVHTTVSVVENGHDKHVSSSGLLRTSVDTQNRPLMDS